MAKYRAKGSLYVGGHLLNPGTEFESDAVPGKNWEPLDDEAKTAHRARFPQPAAPAAPDPEPKVVEEKADPAQVEIPDGWIDLSKKQVVALSRKLGAPHNNTYTQAVAFIEKVKAARGQGA